MPTPAPSIPSVTTIPEVGSATYDADAYAWMLQQQAQGPALQALGENAYANAVDAAASAAAAGAASALTAFKGAWSSLAGALAMPASVLHAGRFWALLSPLADVTAATPGVHAAWVQIRLNATAMREITTSTATLVAGDHAVITYAGACALTLPSVIATDDTIIIDPANGRIDNTIDTAGNKLGGVATTYTTSPAKAFGIKVVSPALGWRTF